MTRGEELAWCAALFEGEGSLSWSPHLRRSRQGQWQARLQMTDEDVVRRFHQLIGVGTVHQRIRATDINPHFKPQWCWCASAQEDVLNFIALIIDMMGTRRLAKMLECVGDLTSYASILDDFGPTTAY